MNELTDGQIDAIPFPAIDYSTAHVIRTHRRTFARAVIAADRELQDAKLTNAPTDSQINDALKVFACTVIGAERAIQDASWLEELRAYELTCSNLRGEIARLNTACDKMSDAELMGRGVPANSTPEMLQAVIGTGYYHDNNAQALSVLADEYRTQVAAAPQPPAHEGRSDAEIIDQTEEVAAILALTYGGSVIAAGATYRESTHPKAQCCWDTACKIQEILTATDVENALHGIKESP